MINQITRKAKLQMQIIGTITYFLAIILYKFMIYVNNVCISLGKYNSLPGHRRCDTNIVVKLFGIVLVMHAIYDI